MLEICPVTLEGCCEKLRQDVVRGLTGMSGGPEIVLAEFVYGPGDERPRRSPVDGRGFEGFEHAGV
jgi:hypothetical protein